MMLEPTSVGLGSSAQPRQPLALVIEAVPAFMVLFLIGACISGIPAPGPALAAALQMFLVPLVIAVLLLLTLRRPAAACGMILAMGLYLYAFYLHWHPHEKEVNAGLYWVVYFLTMPGGLAGAAYALYAEREPLSASRTACRFFYRTSMGLLASLSVFVVFVLISKVS